MALELERIDAFRHRIRRDSERGMRTDVMVSASGNLLRQIEKDQSLLQAVNVAALPGIVGPSLAMPDIHQGYGFPIGCVAATDYRYGVVSPGGVGFDINCGVRLATTTLQREQVVPKAKDLLDQIFRDVPCGAGADGRVKLNPKQLNEVLQHGAGGMVKNGYGEERDLEFAEERGALATADPAKVSARAKEWGSGQLAKLPSAAGITSLNFSMWKRFTMTTPHAP